MVHYAFCLNNLIILLFLRIFVFFAKSAFILKPFTFSFYMSYQVWIFVYFGVFLFFGAAVVHIPVGQKALYDFLLLISENKTWIFARRANNVIFSFKNFVFAVDAEDFVAHFALLQLYRNLLTHHTSKTSR